MSHEDSKPKIQVSVATPDGSFPAQGANEVQAMEPVESELQRARQALHIHDTPEWVVFVSEPDGSTRPVDPQLSYRDNALHGRVALEWHPRQQVEVSISTPAGYFPVDGFNEVEVNEEVDAELQRARSALHLDDTATWVVRVIEPDGGTRPVEPGLSFRGNALRGRVRLRWHPSSHVEVSISTTSGFFPAEGFDAIPGDELVAVELEKAKNKLNIKDINGWIASVIEPGGKRQIDPSRSYKDNGLHGKVEIDWGPSEGGGG